MSPGGRSLGKLEVSWSWGLERSHCVLLTLNKATVVYSPVQITYLVIFVSCFLFLLLTAGLSFCQCVKDSMWMGGGGGRGSVGIC